MEASRNWSMRYGPVQVGQRLGLASLSLPVYTNDVNRILSRGSMTG